MTRTNIISLLLITLLVVLQYKLWFEPGGFMDMLRLKKELAVQTAVNNKLKVRNQALVADVHNLQNNDAAIEARARNELGMVKKGEVFYQVVKQDA